MVWEMKAGSVRADQSDRKTVLATTHAAVALCARLADHTWCKNAAIVSSVSHALMPWTDERVCTVDNDVANMDALRPKLSRKTLREGL